jgi:voltage-gated potassium channel
VAFKAWTRRILVDPTSPSKPRFDRAMAWLIVFSVLLLGIDFTFEPTGWVLLVLHVLDYMILAVFAFDYFGRLWLVEPEFPSSVRLRWVDILFYHLMARLRFILKPANLIDLASILPLIPYFRVLRVLRLLKLLQAVRLFTYNPFEPLEGAIRRNSLLYAYSFAFVVMAVSAGSVLTFLAEHRANPAFAHFGNAVWWAVVTITTVGYGDVAPVTAGGKLVAILLMFSGMFLLALFAGVISKTLVNQLLDLREERVRMSGLVDQVVICGWNRNGPLLLEELALRYPDRMPRIVVFANQDPPHDFDNRFIFVKGDPTKEAEYEKVRLDVAKTVLIVADRDDQDADARSVLTAFTIRSFEKKLAGRGIQRKCPLHLCAEVIDPENLSFFKTAGVDEIIQSARIGCSLLAHGAGAPETGQVFYDLLTQPDQQIKRLPVPSGMPEPCRFLDVAKSIKQDQEALAIGLVRNGALFLNPPADEILGEGDELLVLNQQIALARVPEEGGLIRRLLPRLRK